MLFNSITFIFFLMIVFTLYWLPISKNRKHQNVVLLIASYVFYGWWDYRFLSLIVFSSILDFILAKAMDKEENKRKRKTYLFLSLFFNLGLLFVFKYFNFFIDSFLSSFSIENTGPFFQIALPVGISFYTFQTLSYSIDVYQKKLAPTKNILNFLTFVSFFPQLVAGPIERARNFLPQIEFARKFNYTNAVLGCRFILYGFFKKVVIADNLAEIVNIIYEVDAPYSGLMNLLGVSLFAIQIYCDFSGYSDIAIGTAKLFNINLMTNFRRPYFSKSLTEFWGRWHISLSTWFRDYLYIPLGGNRLSNSKTLRNLFLTFLISGLWHGANWTFVIWGAIHGVFIVIEKLTANKQTGKKGFGYFVTFTIVLLSWVFFRAESLPYALNYLRNMFDFSTSFVTQLNGLFAAHSEITIGHFLIMMSLAFAFIVFEWFVEKGKLIETFNNYKVVRVTSYLIVLNLILLFGYYRSASEFIYFQF